jgi:hypothetical protein
LTSFIEAVLESRTDSSNGRIKESPEAVFLVSLRTSSFPAGNEVYGKSIESASQSD